jgi:hypothetical protein
MTRLVIWISVTPAKKALRSSETKTRQSKWGEVESSGPPGPCPGGCIGSTLGFRVLGSQLMAVGVFLGLQAAPGREDIASWPWASKGKNPLGDTPRASSGLHWGSW